MLVEPLEERQLLSLGDPVGAFDAAPAPTGVDLLAGSDTGVSSTDNLTRLDNSGTASRLQFGVSGTAAGATVTIYADGTAVGSATASGTTTTVITNGARDLADGSHSITARQMVPGSTESPDSPALSITVDTLAPAYPTAPDLQAASDGGVSQTDNVTNDATPTFTVAAGTYFRFYRDTVKISGDYQTGTSYTPAVQPDGSYNYQVSAADAAGNESALSSALAVTIDTAAPTASITPVSPDPRYAWVFNVDFAFSERAFNVALSKLSLSRDGGGNLLGAGQTVTSPTGDNIHFRLAGLAPVTTAPGHYVLTLAGAGSGISDRAGNLLVAGAVEDWTTRPTVFDGTSGDDRFVFSSDGTDLTLTVTLAGGSPAQYVYPASDQVTLTLNGLGGNDQIAIFGGPGTEAATISRYTVDVTGPGYHIIGSSLETISVDARGGSGQTASLYDGPDDDVFTASAGFRTGSMVGTGAGNVYRNSVKNFDTVSGYATVGGTGDKAYLYDSNGNDTFESQAGLATDPHSSIQRVSGGTGLAAYVYAGAGFEYVYGASTAGGLDEAVLYGSDGDDSMRFQPGYTSGTLIAARAYITRPGAYFSYAQNFKKITGYAEDGNDAVAFFDTAGSDIFTASPTQAQLDGPAGSNVLNIATGGWETVRAFSTIGGYDKAYLTGSTGDDSFTGCGKPRSNYAGMGRLSGTGYFLEIHQFEEAYVDLLGGNDTAKLYDGTANDYFWANLVAAVLTDGTVDDATGDLVTAGTYFYKVYGFDSAASDRVNLWGTSGGTNTKRVIAPLDYVLATYGTWTDAP